MEKRKLLFVSFFALLVISLVMVEDSAASSETTVSIDPPVIQDPSMGPGALFTVDVVVDYVENLWGYQFWLSFNPEVIHGVSVENGPFLGSAGGTVQVAPGAGFDNVAGELKLFGASVFFLGEPPPDSELPDGGGVLATITFEVVGYGKSGIILGDDTGLLDSKAEWIIHGPESLKHGQFANAQVHDVAVTHISTQTSWCYQGDPIYITVITENLGDFMETFDVKVYSTQIGGSTEEIFIGMEAVEELAPGASKSLLFVWDTTDIAFGSYRIHAEAIGVPGESGWTDNNIISTRFAGIGIRPNEATLLDLVISWVKFAVRAGLPVAAFVMITVVFFKSLMSVKTRWPVRLWKRKLK